MCKTLEHCPLIKNREEKAMNLTHLRYALEVERTRSITKAAQNLYMGQPNLSKAIKERFFPAPVKG